MIRLIAIDIDGTVLTSTNEVTEETISVIEEATKNHILVVPTSGRVRSTLPEEIMSLKHIPYSICSSGAVLKDEIGKKKLFSSPIETKTALAILDAIEDEEVLCEFYIDQEGYVDVSLLHLYWKFFDEDFIDDYIKLINKVSKKELRKIIKLKPVEKFDIKSKDKAQIKRILKKLEPFDNLNIENDNGIHLEIMNKDIDKVTALKALVTQLGLRPEEVMSIGDSANDLRMIEYAGLGVAMGQSPDLVKASADKITSTNDQNGLAEAIREVLQEC